MMKNKFGKRISIEQVEEGNSLMPKFDYNGLIPVITVESGSELILMHGYMNEESLDLSIDTKLAHYWSRSRKKIWKKPKLLCPTIKKTPKSSSQIST